GLAGAAFDKENIGGLRSLSLDEAALRQKLEENPRAVAELFDAIGNRLANVAQEYTRSDGLLPKMDREFEGQIRRIKDRMTALEQRMELRERTLRRQFEALESALRRLQSQQLQLQNQIGSLPTWDKE